MNGSDIATYLKFSENVQIITTFHIIILNEMTRREKYHMTGLNQNWCKFSLYFIVRKQQKIVLTEVIFLSFLLGTIVKVKVKELK